MMLLHQRSYTCHSGLHYNGKSLYDKSIHIQMMLDTRAVESNFFSGQAN